MNSKRWLPVCIILALCSCDSGYQLENNQQSYITYDEGSGKSTRKLNVDFSTFKVLSDKEFAKDKEKVYYLGSEIMHADATTFEYIDKKYCKDSHLCLLVSISESR